MATRRRNAETLSVQNPALLAAGGRPDVLAWRQQVGLFRQFQPPYAPVRIGTPGQPDAVAVVAVTITPEMVGRTIGAALFAEFKRPGADLSPEQALYRDACVRRGFSYRVVRSAADMLAAIDDLQAGRWG